MPEYTHDHRQMIQAEGILWHMAESLKHLKVGEFQNRLDDAEKEITAIAKELRFFNDWFDTDRQELLKRQRDKVTASLQA